MNISVTYVTRERVEGERVGFEIERWAMQLLLGRERERERERERGSRVVAAAVKAAAGTNTGRVRKKTLPLYVPLGHAMFEWLLVQHTTPAIRLFPLSRQSFVSSLSHHASLLTSLLLSQARQDGGERGSE